MKIEEVCKQCEEETETIEHLFFHCGKSKLIWKLSLVNWDGVRQHTNSFMEWWQEHGVVNISKELPARHELIAYILWHIWKACNAWNFSNENRTEREIVK